MRSFKMIILFVVLISSLVTSLTVNKEAYKVVLKQGSYAQYIQFNVAMPPTREFTICTWFKVYAFNATQNIYTYTVNDNNQMIKVWIDLGGYSMRVSFAEETTSLIPVGLKPNIWYHVCLTHQPDYSAIALYLNSVLVFCGVLESINGHVLPSEGILILGKSTSGKENSFNGEIYGTNMISSSTIEKKYTTAKPTKNDMYTFYIPEKKMYLKYRKTEDQTQLNTKPKIQNSMEEPIYHKYNKYQNQQVPGPQFGPRPLNGLYLDVDSTVQSKTLHENKIKFLFNDAYSKNNYSVNPNTRRGRQFKMNIMKKYVIPEAPLTLLDHDVPPTENQEPSIFSTSENDSNLVNSETHTDELSDKETPPPVFKDTKIYGQWTSSKYAGKLFNAIKTINTGNNRDIFKNPPSLPLRVSYPYPESKFSHGRYVRDTRKQQINVQILEDDIRKNILKRHEKTVAKSVEIISRGEAKRHTERIYRNAGQFNVSEHDTGLDESRNGEIINQPDLDRLILPSKKSLNKSDDVISYDPYINSLSLNNKWYNIPIQKKHKLQRDFNFGLQEFIINPHQGKMPITKVIGWKTSDNKKDESEVKSTNETRLLRTLADSLENKLHPLPNNPFIVKVYPKRINHKSLFERDFSEKNFNRNVKLGNALNENDVIKKDEEKLSFEGSNEKIPEVNRYFSSNGGGVHLNDDSSETIPGSLVHKPCEMAKIHERSPSSHKMAQKANIAKEFVEISYTQCSLDDTIFENHSISLVYWNKSPVSLFGGARHKTATDLCGFFGNAAQDVISY